MTSLLKSAIQWANTNVHANDQKNLCEVSTAAIVKHHRDDVHESRRVEQSPSLSRMAFNTPIVAELARVPDPAPSRRRV